MEDQFLSQNLQQKKLQREQDLQGFQKNTFEAEEEVRRWNKQKRLSNEQDQKISQMIDDKENIGYFSNKNQNKNSQKMSGVIQEQSFDDFPEEQIQQKLKNIRNLLGLNGKSKPNLNESSPKQQQIQQIFRLDQSRISDEKYTEFANTFGKNDKIKYDFNTSNNLQEQSEFKFKNNESQNNKYSIDVHVNYKTQTFNKNFKSRIINERNDNNQFIDEISNTNKYIDQEVSEQKIDTRRFLNEYNNNQENNFDKQKKQDLQQIYESNLEKANYDTQNSNKNNSQQINDVSKQVLTSISNLGQNNNSFNKSYLIELQNQFGQSNQFEISNQFDKQNSLNYTNSQSYNAFFNQGSFIDSDQKDMKNNFADDYTTKIHTGPTQQASYQQKYNTRQQSQNDINNDLKSMNHLKTESSHKLSDQSKRNYLKQQNLSSNMSYQFDEEQIQSLLQTGKNPFQQTLQDKSIIPQIRLADKSNTTLINQNQLQIIENSNLYHHNRNQIKNQFLQTYSPPKKQIYLFDSSEKQIKIFQEIKQSNFSTDHLNYKFKEQIGIQIDSCDTYAEDFEQQLKELTNKNKILMNDNFNIIQQKEQLNQALMKKEQEITHLQQCISDLEKKLEDKQDETKLKRKLEMAIQENNKSLQDQIEELQQTICEQTFEMQNRTNQEKFLKHRLTQQQNSTFLREQELKNEILFLRKEIDNMKYNREIIKTKGETDLKSRFMEMETDLHITRSQYHTLTQEKTLLDQQLEEQYQASQQSQQKIQNELEIFHQQEIKELEYYVKSIKCEYESIMQQLIKTTQKKKDEQSFQQAKIKKFTNNLLVENDSDKAQEGIDEKQELKKQITILIQEKNILNDDKFKLSQQNTWLQLKLKTQSYMDQKVEVLFYERRFNKLTEMVHYWKGNCQKICKDYIQQLHQIKKENENLKSSVYISQKKFLLQYENIIKDLAQKYQIENEQNQLKIKEMQQKYQQSQTKLADARSKLKDITSCQTTQNNSILANQVFAPIDFSKYTTTEKKAPINNKSKQNTTYVQSDYSVNFKQVNQKVITQTKEQIDQKSKKKKKDVF